jgi:hypothetical protein
MHGWKPTLLEYVPLHMLSCMMEQKFFRCTRIMGHPLSWNMSNNKFSIFFLLIFLSHFPCHIFYVYAIHVRSNQPRLAQQIMLHPL